MLDNLQDGRNLFLLGTGTGLVFPNRVGSSTPPKSKLKPHNCWKLRSASTMRASIITCFNGMSTVTMRFCIVRSTSGISLMIS